MQRLTRSSVATDEWARLRSLFLPDRAGPKAGLHVLETGNGELFVDRWPDPRAVLARTGMDHQLAGDATALTREMLVERALSGTVEASPAFASVLRAAYPEVRTWNRVIQEIPAAIAIDPPTGVIVRKLVRADAPLLGALPQALRWIFSPWGGAENAAASGYVFGAIGALDTFDSPRDPPGDSPSDPPGAIGATAPRARLLSVALPFHIGDRYEDLGVVTVPEAARRGLSACCAARVVDEVAARGRCASWSTTPDNDGSLAVAAKLGARHVRNDVLYVVNWTNG